MSQPKYYQTQRINGLISRLVPANSIDSGQNDRHLGNVVSTPQGKKVTVIPNLKTIQVIQVSQNTITSLASTSYANGTARPIRPYAVQPLSCVSLPSNRVSPSVSQTPLESPSQRSGQIDLRIRNVVTMFNTCCHLNLHTVAMRTCNVIYEQNRGVVVLQTRRPRCFVKIWSSGKVIVSGNLSEELARRNSRGVARMLQKCIGPQVHFADYRVTNIMATCKLPFAIRIRQLAVDFPKESSYEPELSVGLLWRSDEPKATLRIHATGSITITGAESQDDILKVMESLFPVLLRYKSVAGPDVITKRAGSLPDGLCLSKESDPGFEDEDFLCSPYDFSY
ncbi:transcription factor TFIID [Trichuris suis]|nr:transcription factor TFIID [Trichuris suis]